MTLISLAPVSRFSSRSLGCKLPFIGFLKEESLVQLLATIEDPDRKSSERYAVELTGQV